MIQFFSTILENKPFPDFTGGFTVIDGATYDLDPRSVGNGIYGPNSYYYNGSTYMVLKREENLSTGYPVVIKYSGDINNVQKTSISGTILLRDYHDYPSVFVDSSGYIWVFIEQHSLIPIIYKSNSPEDISAFTRVSTTGLTGRNYDYIKPGFIDGIGYFMLARYTVDSLRWGMCFHTSANGIAWTKVGDITLAEVEDGATDVRHYPTVTSNWIQDNFLYSVFYKRVYSASPWRENRVYTMKTPVNASTFGKVWHNYQETFSKDISTSGIITDAELNTNYMVINDPTFSYQSSLTNSAFINGDLVIGSAINGNGMYKYAGSWNKVSSIISNNSITSFDNRMYFTSWNGIYTAFQKLTDNLSAIESVGNIASPPPSPTSLRATPINTDDIPKGGKFAIALQDVTNPIGIRDTTPNDVYIYECQLT